MFAEFKSAIHSITAAAKSLHSCPTLCNPIDGSPPGSPVPGILQARTLEWVAISFSNAWKWKRRVKKLALNSTFRKLRSWHLVPSLHGKQKKKKWKQWQIFSSWTPKSLDGNCSHEIRRHLLLGRKAMTNLDSLFKSRNVTLLTKVCIVRAMVFPVVMYRCESWTMKKAECQRMLNLPHNCTHLTH